MTYFHFASYNLIGAAIWVLAFTLGGFFFADLPVVQNHFHYVVVAIVIISVLPAVYEFWNAHRQPKQK